MVKPDNKLNANKLYLIINHIRCPKVVCLQFLIICFFILGPVLQVQAKTDLANLVKEIQPSVVTITTYDDKKNTLKQGSGFFIDGTGVIITNYHVLKEAYYAKVKTYDGHIYPIDNIVAENKYVDLIKAHVDIPRKHIKIANITQELPEIAEHIIVIGSPHGLEQSVSDGIVSSVRSSQYPTLIQITAPVSPGSSGGPVINRKGKVIGVTTFYITRGQNLNFAVPSKYILDLGNFVSAKSLYMWAASNEFRNREEKIQEREEREETKKLRELYDWKTRYNRKREEFDKERNQLNKECQVLEDFRGCFRPEVFNRKLYELNLKRARFDAKVEAFNAEIAVFNVKQGTPLKPPNAQIEVHLNDGEIVETDGYLESGDTIIFTDGKRVRKIKKSNINNIVRNHQ